jgi:hypothetical protein
MRVVVDTNVFISAALKESSPPGTAAHLAAANHLLLKSEISEQEPFPLWRNRFLHVGPAAISELAERSADRRRAGGNH